MTTTREPPPRASITPGSDLYHSHAIVANDGWVKQVTVAVHPGAPRGECRLATVDRQIATGPDIRLGRRRNHEEGGVRPQHRVFDATPRRHLVPLRRRRGTRRRHLKEPRSRIEKSLKVLKFDGEEPMCEGKGETRVEVGKVEKQLGQ